nr:hypothetical protein [Tanacetum cinerariifolium]
MSRDVLTACSTMRILLLYRGEYSQWRERFINYLEEQMDGEATINSIQNGDHPLLVVAQVSLSGTAQNAIPTLKDPKFWTTEEKKTQKIDHLARSLLIQGLLNDIYSLVDSNKTAKDLWDALERQVCGSEYGEQDKKATILYEYETFKAIEREQLLDTYLRYLQVINDLKKCGYKKDNCELNYKFLNSLQPEWKQYGTLMRQTKNLMDINIDALYNILKQNQGDMNGALGYKKKAVVVTSYPLALVAEKTKVSKRKEKVEFQTESEESDDEDISDLKKITALLAKAFNQKKYYAKPTNNNLRTSSASSSANKKPEHVKSVEKKEDKKADEKKRDTSKVKCYNCKKEGHFAKDCKKAKVKDYIYYKTKMLLAKKDSDEQVLLAKDQASMESSSDSDQEINANMVFMAQIEKVLSDSDESSSSAEETIAEVAYYTSKSENESEFETSEYYDNSTNFGLFVNNDNDQEIFYDAIESASKNFIENHIDSQKDYDKSEVDHNDSEAKDHLIDKLIQKFNHKFAKCHKHIEKANQQSKDLETQKKDVQEKYDVLINQVNTFEEQNNEFNEQMKVLNEKNADLLAQIEVLQDQLKVKHVVIDTYTECQAQYAKLEEERYEYMIRYSALCDNDKQHRKKIDEQEILFDKMSRQQTNQTIHMIMPSKDTLYNGRKGIGFENPSYFGKAKYLRPSLYDEKVIGLGYTLMFLTHSDEALEIEKFKRARENKIEQTSSLKLYVSTVILEKIIIDLEDEVASLLEKEKANLETIVSLKSKGFESSENAIFESENQSENDCQVVEKECHKVIIDSGCSKHMTDSRALLTNFVEKFLGTVHFSNNDFAVNAGYGDVVIGSMTIKKLKEKWDIGVFVGYSKEFVAFRIYNKRTRKIYESVNVNFDKISEMASKQFSLELNLSNLNETGKSSNPSVSQVSKTSKKDLKDLFQNFYDEYFDSSKIMKSSTTNVESSNVEVPSHEEEVFHESSASFQEESSSSSLNDDVQQSPEEVILPQTNT